MDSSISSELLQGIDVSADQGTIDWGQVAAAGKVFAFIKATEGVTLVDPQFQANWAGAYAAALLRGAYHFYRPEDDPVQQAQSFLAAADLQPGDLPPALDVEVGMSGDIVSGIQTWLATVQKATGVAPVIYASLSDWNILQASGLGEHPLWIAEYQVASPRVQAEWQFWQYSDTGFVGGIATAVDLDLFQGSYADLLGLCIPEPAAAS